jgi:hypothetical protein
LLRANDADARTTDRACNFTLEKMPLILRHVGAAFVFALGEAAIFATFN